MLRYGDQGDAVGAIQQRLIEAGLGVDAGELSVHSFGPSTQVAVRAFQSSQGLAADGIVGPATDAALARPKGAYVAAGWRIESPGGALGSVLWDAHADVGKRESPDGSNDGPALAKFRTGGQPWCAFAVSTWFEKAGSPFGRIGSVWGIRDWAAKAGRLVGDDSPALPGDVFLILRGGGHGHTGLVSAVDGTKLSTIEGNCGNAVRACVRDRSTIQALARPTKA